MKTISYSSIRAFLTCKRKYFWYYVKGLELKFTNVNFVFGNVMHFGLHQIYSKNSKYIIDTIKFLNEEKDKIKFINPKDEEKLNKFEYQTRGMLFAYNEYYSSFIKKVIHIKNEFSIEHVIDDYLFKGRIDNILKYKGQLYIHEIKSVKTLSEDYINNIKNDLQTHIYFHVNNLANKKFKIKGILFDAIQKPGIRQKEKEETNEYLQRLKEYYLQNKEFFYMDKIEKPLLSKNRIINLIKAVIADMKTCVKEDDYYPNETACYQYFRCEFFDLCHIGENKETLFNFKRRENDKNNR